MADDMEEYQTTFYTSPNCSTTSLPALEVMPVGLVHDSPALYTTVLESMIQAVPIDIKASNIGTKRSGLFFVGSAPMPVGEMLFLTNPLVMARSPDEGQTTSPRPHDGPMRDTDVCDYCFKGPQTFTEKGASGCQPGSTTRRCTGCNLLSFCNKACHQKAWKHFHKFECGLLKTLQRRDPAFLLHLRVLLMDKADSIPENVMKVIRDLDIPFTEPLQPPLSHNIKNCALHAYHLLSLENRDLSFIRDVLCRILGNQAVVSSADETAIVHCFDIALAMLNHSCEPNAFIFVEGRQTRVRSLRSIQPGEEITVALVDTRLDVESRREALRLQTLNDDHMCNCDMCNRDVRTMSLLAQGDNAQMAALRRYHAGVLSKALQLIQDIKKTVWDKKKAELIRKFVSLADGEFIAYFGKDPMHGVDYKPIPWLHMAGAAMFLEIRELESALYYATLSFMFHERHFDPTSVTDLRILVNALRAICELPESDKQYQHFFAGNGRSLPSGFPTHRELSVFTVSCLVAFGLLAVKVYGPKLGFVRAVLRWGRDGETLCMPLKPCSAEFNAMALGAQQKLMLWCLGDRKARFFPINAPTEAQYAELTEVLREREEQVEKAKPAEQAELFENAEEYEKVEQEAKATKVERAEKAEKAAQAEQTDQTDQADQAGQARQTRQARQARQARKHEQQIDMDQHNYEQKVTMDRKAGSLFKRERERREHKAIREEDDIENEGLENRLQAMFEAELRKMRDKGADKELGEKLDKLDKKLEKSYGREDRGSAVEEVCRAQANWPC